MSKPKSKFKKGDRVTLGERHFAWGREYFNEARAGDSGVVTGFEFLYDQAPREYDEPVYNVEWDAGPTSCVDESSLEPEPKPVTEKELAYVYKSLGVQHG